MADVNRPTKAVPSGRGSNAGEASAPSRCAPGGREGLWLALAHLAVLTVAFGVVGRLALRRFA